MTRRAQAFGAAAVLLAMTGLGVLAAPSFAGAHPAAATHRQSPHAQGEADAGMQRMHDLMVSDNPGMQRMHDLMVSPR